MTDVSVQYFSHLNGLQLDNRWGDMIALLDTCLVNGIVLPYITDCLVDANGNLALTFDAPHKSLLFQIVEFKNFNPSSLNGKYRIIGVPNATQLILKASNAIVPITIGQSKLSSLGYEIVFTGTNKRVYRALNPNSNHPYIRVDESITSPDGTTGIYTSTYAKYAMVGLLERMDHIDDYEKSDVLQLPFDPVDPSKNWKITGTGSNVVRGWSRWYWRKRGEQNIGAQYSDSDTSITTSNGKFTLSGNYDAFYLVSTIHGNIPDRKITMGCGLFNSNTSSSVIPNWFLGSTLTTSTAGNFYNTIYNSPNMTMLTCHSVSGKFLVPKNNILSRLSQHEFANCSVTGYGSGAYDYHPKSSLAATDFPFSDDDGYLRGSLKHICFLEKLST